MSLAAAVSACHWLRCVRICSSRIHLYLELLLPEATGRARLIHLINFRTPRYVKRLFNEIHSCKIMSNILSFCFRFWALPSWCDGFICLAIDTHAYR
ncbi:Uncharacterized protein APZ42_006936 [Daphnia magna]|uniref:Uncharacterized protein n=1 Tax=Daphnia magna TaxID=35525 RepID=A0A164FM41_9CRUS|nr:Uncharacterized protein APZ42_006936 [Daphnia magna]